jgi:serine/threonine-protein kinase
MTLPERLGKYEVVEALGESANAEVFGAFDPDVNRVVAVKTVRKDLAELDDHAARALARWRNESRLAGRLSHPGIVAVYDYGESGSVAYLAVEFVQGHRLSEYLDRGIRFSAADAVAIAAQVLDALGHAHDHGVRHGAVGPASILVTRGGEAKLADFGCAATEDDAGSEPAELTGEPGYVAPEQHAGERVDARADLFAAGAVFFRLLTGRAAYRGTAEQVAYRLSRGSIPLPSQVGEGRGWERYDDVVSRALARDPAKRFQTAGELRRALLDAYGGPPAPVSPDILIKDPVRGYSLLEAGDPPLRPQRASGDIPLKEARPQVRPPEEPLPRHTDSSGRWRVALVGAVVLISLAVVASIAYWTAPEFGPRASRPEPAPRPGTTAAEPRAPAADATSRGGGATAQADRRTVESIAAAPTPLAPRRSSPPAPTRSSPPAPTRSSAPAPTPSAPAIAEPPSVPEAVAPERQPVAAQPPQAPAPRVAAPVQAEPAVGFFDNQAIAFKVATRLSFDRMLYRSGIRVESAGGIVTLRGHLPTREHVAHAIAVARAVEGVRDVRSELRIGVRDYVFPDPVIGLQ